MVAGLGLVYQGDVLMLCKRCGKAEAEVIRNDDDDAYDYFSDYCPACNDRLAETYREQKDWEHWHS